MTVALTKRRFTVDEYHRMAEAGILTDEDRVELIDGEIVEMTPIGARHAWCVLFLTEFFVKNLADRALVSPQGPLRLGRCIQLQPDLALLRPPRDAYRKAVPAYARTSSSSSRWPTRRSSATARSSCPGTPRWTSARCGSWTSKARPSRSTARRPLQAIATRSAPHSTAT